MDRFPLRFQPPYDWDGILAFLSPRAIPGVETVDAGIYRRTFSHSDVDGYYSVSLDPAGALLVSLEIQDPAAVQPVIDRIRAQFRIDVDWTPIGRMLGTDPVLSRLLHARPGMRVPGCFNGFELAVRAILGQQITVKGASSLAGALTARYGRRFDAGPGLTHLFPSPQCLADAPLPGMPTARAATIRSLARAVADGRIRFDGKSDSADFVERLLELPGIGPWTAQYIAMRALGDPDAFPSSDLGLLHALNLKNPRDLEARAECWRPWRAYAAMYLWSSLSSRPASRRDR